jgi:LEA14-like dessication related protein
MNKKKLLQLFFLLSIIIFFASCKKPQGFEYRDIKDFKIDSIGFEKSTISMNLVYFNPNNFGVELKHVDCDVFVNNNYLGKYQLDTLMHIAKRSEFIMPSTMQVDMRNLFKNSLNAFFAQQIQLDVKGNTRLGKAGIFINVPFTYSGIQKISLF